MEHERHVWRHPVQGRYHRPGGERRFDNGTRLDGDGEPEGPGHREVHVDRQCPVRGLRCCAEHLVGELSHQALAARRAVLA